METSKEAKDKAVELVDRFTELEDVEMYIGKAKQCAIICVDEILKALESDRIIYGSVYRYEENEFWQQVKHEIQQL